MSKLAIFFSEQVVPAIQTHASWQYKCFEAAITCDRVIDFKAWLREDLNKRQSRCFGGKAVWEDLPTPIGDFADLDEICELIINDLPHDHPVRVDWEKPASERD